MIQTYYHASHKRLKDTLLIPRVPKNRLTESGSEDNITPRVCVSQSLPEAVSASGHIDLEKHRRVYIYTCQIESGEVVQPTRKQVNDSYITGELWIVKPVEVQLLTILHISDITDVDRQRSTHMYLFEDKESTGDYRYRDYCYVSDSKNNWSHHAYFKKSKGERKWFGYHYDIPLTVGNLSIILNNDFLLGYAYSLSGVGDNFELTLTKDDHILKIKTGDIIQSWLVYDTSLEDGDSSYTKYLEIVSK